MATQTLCIHHITATASDPPRNLDFRTQFLGLRLVKLTGSLDPGIYRLYFGNAKGLPASILTGVPPGVVESGQASAKESGGRR